MGICDTVSFLLRRLSPLRYLLVFLIFALMLGSGCRQESTPTPPPILGQFSQARLKILVADEGVYRVTLSDLQQAGLSIETMSPDRIYLSQGGTAVPYTILEDDLVFYGLPPDDRYAATRPYILEIGKPGTRMAETAVAPATSATLATITRTLHLEENSLYETRAYVDGLTDLWFWQTVGRRQKIEIPFNLPAVSDRPSQLQLNLWGLTQSDDIENDHDFDLILNEQMLDTIRWDGAIHYQTEIDLPPGVLQTGANHLIFDNEVDGASPIDIMQLNWIQLQFTSPPTVFNDQLTFTAAEGIVTLSSFSSPPIILDIQQPNMPRLLTNWQFDSQEALLAVRDGMRITAVGRQGFHSPAAILPVRQSDWKNRDNQADLLIVTTDTLAPALEPLITAREADGLTTALIPIMEVYDEFTHGAETPQAIHQLVTYATENWQAPPPRYLFLVGDATSDYQNNLGTGPQNHIPSLMIPVEFSGETISDSRLVDVDGDTKPDLAVGRWPVDSITAVESLVERTLAYEQGTAVNRILFATDGTETQFANQASRLWQGAGFSDEQVTHLNGVPATEMTAQWNKGAWLTTYIGHGSVELWGKDNLFNVEAVSGLSATNPPIVIQLTCLTGLFSDPVRLSLSETMLAHENGPVLVVAATSLTLSNNQEVFGRFLLENLQDRTILRIGDAFQQAKLSLPIELSAGLLEISDTFVLLGDPTATITRPQSP